MVVITMTDQDIEKRQCKCDILLSEKKLVTYRFHSLGIKIYVCKNCLQHEPFNRFIEEFVGDKNNA